MNKVSIITTVYNTEEYVDKCIGSLLHQTYENIEIILIDGGSTDKTSEKCYEYEKAYENVKLIKRK